ncbi:hypothetical protein GQR58_028111 [Nymphon striatum]|nr:hypothetical protein GQR58_028111 [Nymphon striatum]
MRNRALLTPMRILEIALKWVEVRGPVFLEWKGYTNQVHLKKTALKCGRRINTGKNECTSGLCSKCMENTPMKSDAITLKQKETPKARSAQEALVSLAKNEQYLRHSNFPGIPRELQMYYPTSRPMTSTPISTAPHIFASELDMLRTRPFFRVT